MRLSVLLSSIALDGLAANHLALEPLSFFGLAAGRVPTTPNGEGRLAAMVGEPAVVGVAKRTIRKIEAQMRCSRSRRLGS